MNLIESGLSFLEGLALIASPCILPVLPLVLGASVEGGRKRPFGIIVGFVAAFTAFALLSRTLVLALNLDLDFVKYGSLALLALFGLVLVSKTLSEKFSRITRRFAEAGHALGARAGDGFASGVAIGALIGLVWTPCAGPVLAAVLVQIIRQESDWGAVRLVAAFALGAGLPMLLIALMGRSLVARLGFLSRHAEIVRRAFGVLIVAAVVFMALGGTLQPGAMAIDQTPAAQAETATASGLQGGLDRPYPAPGLTGINAWLNSEPLTMEGLRGKVVLIDFWTYSCINCIRTLPYVTKWDRAYRDSGLVIIGVHAPEFEFEKNSANVEAAIAAHGIRYPVALDNNLDTWTAYKNRYWPAHYLIDREGRVVYTHFGEGGYDRTENNIRYLLGLGKNVSVAPAASTVSADQSPETYLGYARARHFSGAGGLRKGEVFAYTAPAVLLPDHWALLGEWRVGPQHITAARAGAALRFSYRAGKVYLVLGTVDGKPRRIALSVDGKPVREIVVGEHRLYELLSHESEKSGLLQLTAQAPGLEAYAFTFGKAGRGGPTAD